MTSYPHSRLVYSREGKIMRVLLSPQEEWLIPITLEEMGKWLPRLVVEIEDRRFFNHRGFDFLALSRAIVQNLRERRIISGASTITTQLIRIAYPRERTFGQKIREIFAAFKLEQHLSKKAILETYLNRISLGGNIRGVEAASLFYFGKRANQLSLAEAALLVGMLPEPERLRPDKNPPRALEKRNLILAKLLERGTISPLEYTIASQEPLPKKPAGFPRYAYHATELLATISSSPFLWSSLSFELQTWLEKAALESLSSLPKEVTACALVVENKTAQVLAYLGNARFQEGEGNWVDCARAFRSPGSALKPFAYALAFERGLYTPSSLIADTPLALGGYVPRNFDERYRGPVSCRAALAQSLNVPAVRIMRTVGPSLFLDTLKQLGFSRLDKNPEHYGDALILGGCEVTPLEMAKAYVALARGGEIVELNFFRDFSLSIGKQIFSPATSYLIAGILSDRTRFLPLYHEEWGSLPPLAFKTGTSYGLRDAWTVAYNPDYTVVVWYGDPSGKPHQELMGLQTATPLAVKIMQKLCRGKSVWYAPPDNIEWREVCALSGKLPSSACQNRSKAPFIKGVSPLKICDLHRFVNGQIVTIWPQELALFLEEKEPRELSTLSPKIPSPLAIASPANRKRYLPNHLTKNARLPLKAETREKEIYWFVDGEFVGKGQADMALFVTFPLGTHIITASSSSGNIDTVTIEVGYPTYPLQEDLFD
ncbi:MAG: penicillin-binding protein 1C [Candidatus Caldatribacteriaceae bacterium]